MSDAGTIGRLRRQAWIDPARCIGCTRCIQACPFDAIIGASRRMHTVIGALCTGCELCVAPCPVDCITMADTAPATSWTEGDAQQARTRREARRKRQLRWRAEASEAFAAPDTSGAGNGQESAAVQRKREIVAAAVRRARERAAGAGGAS